MGLLREDAAETNTGGSGNSILTPNVPAIGGAVLSVTRAPVTRIERLRRRRVHLRLLVLGNTVNQARARWRRG